MTAKPLAASGADRHPSISGAGGEALGFQSEAPGHLRHHVHAGLVLVDAIGAIALGIDDIAELATDPVVGVIGEDRAYLAVRYAITRLAILGLTQ